MSPPTALLQALGETVNAVATARTVDGTSIERRIQWSTSDGSVATVSASGSLNQTAQITARGNGTAVITATAAGVTGGVAITVEQSVASFSFVDGPTDAVQGGSAGTVRVAAVDPGGSPVVSATGAVTLDVDPGSPGSLVGGARSSNMLAGVATFADIQVDAIGAGYRLRADWDGRTASSNPFDIVVAFDALSLTNAAAGSVGILVDGFRGGAALNDFAVVGDPPLAEVGVVAPAPTGRNEVVVFAPNRRPALQAAAWTSGVDTIPVVLEAPLEVDLTIWIVRGPFDTQSARARQAVQTTRDIWSDEFVGIEIDSVEVIDATGDPDASSFFRLTLCNSKNDLEARIGKKEGTINVYYVETVDGGTDRGRACFIGGDHAIMAERSGHELLSHEIGHLLSLTHTDAITQFFDRTNVMHSASSSRRYLTEGQIFRQQFNPNSVVNEFFDLRTSEVRSCPRDLTSSTCPAIEGRIFQDGGFPPTLHSAATLVDAYSPLPVAALSAAEVARRWVDVSCEMEENEGLSSRLIALGDEALPTLEAIAFGTEPLRTRSAALDALALVGTTRARELLREAQQDSRLAVPAARALLRATR